MERNSEIDGIRGWAALLVLTFHFFKETFTGLFSELNHPGYGILFDGRLMVFLFFVLSGDALSNSFFKNDSSFNMHRIVIARYFRLTFPILITCFLVFICVKFGLTYHNQASVIVHSENWLGSFLNFPMSFMGFLRFSLEEVYMNYNGGHSYNPFLWTMSIEILGSIIIFLNCFVLEKIKKQYWLWILISQTFFFFYFGEVLSLFFFGMLLGYIRSQGFFKRIGNLKYNNLFLLFFVALVFILMPFYQNQIFKIYETITFHIFYPTSFLFAYTGLVVFVIYCSNSLKKIFSTRTSILLGEISFPIYILQFNVLITLTSWMIIKFNEHQILNGWMYLIIPITSIVCTIFLALVFRVVEKKALSKINQLIKNKLLTQSN
jgi:peptidoglycan/LPS O-acetylase OafA/YrhL